MAETATPGAGVPLADAQHARAGRTIGQSAALWMQTSRVKSLAISSIAVAVGGAVAAYQGHVSARLLLAWIGSVCIQAGTNLVNVHHNYKAGVAPVGGFVPDPRGSSAPVRLGLLTPAEVYRGALACFAVGIAAGLGLVYLCGWSILAIGVPSVLAGYFYAAPPVRLGYLALGVVTVFIFMGPVMVGGAYYVSALSVSPAAVVASVVVGLLAAAVMHINDVRDYDSDVAHGKRTLTTLVGRPAGSWMLLAMHAAAYGTIVVAVAARVLPWPGLATWLTLPVAIAQLRLVFRERDARRLDDAWFAGVRLHSQFGVLLIAALLAAAAMR